MTGLSVLLPSQSALFRKDVSPTNVAQEASSLAGFEPESWNQENIKHRV
uniref:Transcriptional regulator n=1 Tax=Ascaris lumbricoides TaxID=6252 RepID=A0A0M3HLF0_ASCLU